MREQESQSSRSIGENAVVEARVENDEVVINGMPIGADRPAREDGGKGKG